MTIEFRPVTEEDLQAVYESQMWTFHDHLDESRMPTAREWFELGDYIGAFDGKDPVGAVERYSFEMTVPGGSVTTACIRGVTVLPSHRRRGLLTEMMKRQLAATHESGLSLSALEASETPIYGRFGYGIACEHENWSIERHRSSYREEYSWDGLLKMTKTDRAWEVFPEVYRRAASSRAGVIVEPLNPWWQDVLGSKEGGKNSNFYVEYRESEIEGCAVYQIKGGIVYVSLLLACSDDAYAALWRYLFDIDLVKTIKAWDRPRDDQLVWMLTDARALERKPRDRTWLRLIDVPNALSSRTYAIDGELVFKIRDRFCPWNDGTYHLTGSPSGATCSPTTKSPDITLSVDDLAVPYLGGSPFTPLARAARVEEHTPGALHRADAMFATQLKPWSPMLT